MRLSAEIVQEIETKIGGDPITEGCILDFIYCRYSAKSLLYLPGRVATEILNRPGDFIAAAKRHSKLEVPF